MNISFFETFRRAPVVNMKIVMKPLKTNDGDIR